MKIAKLLILATIAATLNGCTINYIPNNQGYVNTNQTPSYSFLNGNEFEAHLATPELKPPVSVTVENSDAK